MKLSAMFVNLAVCNWYPIVFLKAGGTAAAHMGLETLRGLPVVSKNLLTWSGMHPGLASSYEVFAALLAA